MADLKPQIEQVAQEPASAAVDGQSASNHPIPDIIEADRYLKSQEALAEENPAGGPRSGWACTRMGRVVPPGAI